MYKCQNSTTRKDCANQTEIDNFFENKNFNFAFINNYFDFSDFESPIKPFIDDSLFWELESNKIKKANFYV